jgi:hypothetical protein
MPKSREQHKDKPLTPGTVRKIAASIALTGGLLAGFNALNNAENPVREVPRIETLDDSNFSVSGPEIHTKPGEGLFYEGQEISYLDELGKFNFNKGGHLRHSPVVNNGDESGPSNDVRFDGLQKEDVAYLSRPVISPNAGPNPNGTALVTTADGHENFVFENEARKVGALETVKSYPNVNGATNIQRGTIVAIHDNGMLVRRVNENGVSLGGEPIVAVGVTRIGPELKP